MLYPPILASTQSVFAVEKIPNGYEVKFSLASITTDSEIGHIGILVAKQSNNKSIANTSQYPDGIIYKPFNVNTRSVIITDNDISPSWEPGNLYKIQLRFGSSALPSSWKNFSTWHRTQVEANAFSEWSTAMIVKPINTPTLQIIKDSNLYVGSTSRTSLVASLTPTFFGVCEIPADNKEVEEYYKFEIFQGNTLLESSGWLQHISGEEDAVYFYTLLENQHTYQVTYNIRTNNGYETTTDPFNFIAIRSTWEDLDDLNVTALEDKENARILVLLEATNSQLLTGNFVVTRSSEASDFKRWEDIKFLNYFTESFTPAKICFIDYTIESGITYQYAFQKLNANKIRTNPLYTQKIMIDFEYSYLVRDGIQLRLTFNQKMSSFKHSTLRTKQDTLGDKYPHLLQNGNAYYAEFPITGLITYKGNETETLSHRWGSGTDSIINGQRVIDIDYPYPDNLDTSPTFFKPGADGVYYNGDLVIKSNKFDIKQGSRPRGTRISADTINPKDYEYFDHWQSYPKAELDNISGEYINEYYPDNQDDGRFEDDYYKRNPQIIKPTQDPIIMPPVEYSEGSIDYTISTDLTDNNIFIERKFREKVEEFLNDFTCKLYRSPTEGNIVVNLMNISMTPNEQLGRMVYEFSATAYEVLDNTLSEMNKYGVIDIGEFGSYIDPDVIVYHFGQIDFWPGRESLSVYDKIKAQEEVLVDENFYFNLESIQSFWVEPYPKEKISALINEYMVIEGDNKVPDYLIEFLAASESSPIRMSINGTSIYISPFKVYTLNEIDITSISLESSAMPILVNYVSCLTIQPNSEVQTITSIEEFNDFGQVAGLFSEDRTTLQEYNFEYDSEASLKIATNGLYNIYQSKDIYAVIKEDIKFHIEYSWNSKQKKWVKTKTLTPQIDGSWKDEDGNEYELNGITSITIEADKGTTFYIGSDVNNYEVYEIGRNRIDSHQQGDEIRFESNKIFFKDVFGYANYIVFVDSTFAIIDYTYLMAIKTMSSIEG